MARVHWGHLAHDSAHTALMVAGIALALGGTALFAIVAHTRVPLQRVVVAETAPPPGPVRARPGAASLADSLAAQGYTATVPVDTPLPGESLVQHVPRRVAERGADHHGQRRAVEHEPERQLDQPPREPARSELGDGPEPRQLASERHDTRLRFRIIFGIGHQHADPSDSLCLLRTGGDRPEKGRSQSAQKRHEIATFQMHSQEFQSF